MKKLTGFGAIELIVGLLAIAILTIIMLSNRIGNNDSNSSPSLKITQPEVNKQLDDLMQQRQDLQDEQRRKFDQIEDY